MMDVMTSPKPIPIIILATNMIGEVCTKINPTPTPIMVIPPMAQVLLSSFLEFMGINLNDKHYNV